MAIADRPTGGLMQKAPGLALKSFFAVLFLISGKADAQTPEDQYLEALKLADREVQRLRALEHPGRASLDTRFYSRAYQVGDSWEVAAIPIRSNQAMKAGGSSGEHYGAPAVFRYRVVEVISGSGSRPQARVEIKQVVTEGARALDPDTSAVLLTLNDRVEQSRKTYVVKNSARSIEVSPDGIRAKSSPLELYPLDAPGAFTAVKQESAGSAEIPEALRKLGASPNLGDGNWYEQNDFFGRQIRFHWTPGNPWPTYIKSSQGIAVLLKKGGA